MEFFAPARWTEALEIRAGRPDALPICGGTDVMVELNVGLRRPAALLDLGRIEELRQWDTAGGQVRLGAGVTYTRIIGDLADRLPALAMAARTVGSPQIRNRATVGGNLGTASPAGDAHPVLLATGAEVEVHSVRGARRIPVSEYFTGVKTSVLAPDELIAAVHLPVAAGPQLFAKVGPRAAMVIAVCSFALVVEPDRRRVGTGLGAVGTTALTAPEAEEFLAATVDWPDLKLPAATAQRFGELVAGAARPIDDMRGGACYRRRALSVVAARAAGWLQAADPAAGVPVRKVPIKEARPA